MVLYFVFLGLLILLWLLFVYNLNVTIFFSLNSLKIEIFKLPIINLKNDKFKKFLVRFIPTSTIQVQEEIDLSSLFTLIHYDVIEVKLLINTNDYPKLIIINSFISILFNNLKNNIDKKVTKYTYQVEKSEIGDIQGVIKCNFNIGVILINYLIIKGRYKYAKTN